MPVDFVDREIEMRLSEDEAASPLSFRLASREYKIAEQLATWQDHAFESLKRGRDWRQQQQRWYYRVRTEEGEVYEMYADWSPGRRRKGREHATRWYLHRRLSSAPAERKRKAKKEKEPEEPPSA